MSANLAPLYGRIAGYSAGTSATAAHMLIDNSTLCANSYSYVGAPPYPKFVIIDLVTDRLITGFKLWSYTCTLDATKSVKNYRVGLLSNSASGSSFTEVVSGIVPFPLVFEGTVYSKFHATSITPTPARFVKLYLDSNYGSASELWSAEFEIYGETGATIPTSTTIFSSAVITNTYLRSNAYIYKQIDTIISPINSNAQIIIFDLGAQKFSDAMIVCAQINSDAHIQANYSSALLSDSFVYRNGYHKKPIIIVGKGTSITPSTRNVLLYNTRLSTSAETIINDMITSGDSLNTILDLNVLNLPLGYQNYDWAYDWVVRTYNGAQYKFEARSANTLTELKTLVFSRITQGQLIPRGTVGRYHQWRCHLWASGSGNFELHQFTVKAYVDYTANSLYRALYDKDFTTISTIIKNLQLPYEPVDAQVSLESYIPGDVNNDKVVNTADQTYLNVYLLYNGPAPNPLASGDVNGDGVINILDVTVLNDYLNNHGSPPKKKV